ncbi:MAG: sulfur carrier protein ThiS [Firmicutes bacterium]|jgi:thiamine biosynthesis protein ThiS|nr:sulfur carrier protein ThiS [Bacillota bacterium]
MIKVNGELTKHQPGMTVLDLLKERDLDPEGYTVMVNGKIVAWEQLAKHELQVDDDVRIMFLISGG